MARISEGAAPLGNDAALRGDQLGQVQSVPTAPSPLRQPKSVQHSVFALAPPCLVPYLAPACRALRRVVRPRNAPADGGIPLPTVSGTVTHFVRIRIRGIIGFSGFLRRAFSLVNRSSEFVLAGFSVVAKSTSRTKRNPENPANPINPDSDKGQESGRRHPPTASLATRPRKSLPESAS